MAGGRTRLVGGLAAAVAVLLLVGLFLVVRHAGVSLEEGLVAGIVMVGGIYLSWLIIARTGHATGWVLLVIYLLGALSAISYGYSQWALADLDAPHQGGVTAAWLSQLVWVLQISALYVFMPAYFPDGKLESPVSRWLVRIAAVATGVAVLTSALSPDIFEVDGVEAPLAFLGVPRLLLDLVGGAAFVTLLLCGLVAIGLLVARFRSSQGVRRLQLKWLFWAILLSIVFDLVGTNADGAWTVLALASELAIPIGVAVAITRYRLYAIDKLMRRTVSYAILTAVLVGVYAGLVLGAQTLLGVEEAPDVVVAGSTLAIAALFQPMRRRVQRLVDLRFNRRHAGARAAVTEFTNTVRDDIDLDTLIQDVLRTTADAVQPATVALALIDPGKKPHGSPHAA